MENKYKNWYENNKLDLIEKFVDENILEFQEVCLNEFSEEFAIEHPKFKEYCKELFKDTIGE